MISPTESGIYRRDFDATLSACGLYPLQADRIETLQVNFGPNCNLTCRHCHVGAGPMRRESIGRATLESCLRVLREGEIAIVDITGGAPERHPEFRWFVEACRRLDRRVLVRSNLTVLLDPGQEQLPTFLREHGVGIIASLPCYTEENVDAQRGPGVFTRSIEALRLLNGLGYGRDAELTLDLVYNPGGASLPGPQADLETDFRRELGQRHGVVFHRLLTLTNMPIGRFRGYLMRSNLYESYMRTLVDAFNPEATPMLMCRSTLSVAHDGAIYDCDFNQMLGLACNHGAPDRIEEFDREVLSRRRIVTGEHCFGCTAGAGSSCGGALA
jgi:radical SAM/Cys-rich protein